MVETPRGNRNKFDFDEEHKLFKLAKVLPEGMVFPFEFGFIPSTRGEDGDPVDILVLMDAPTTTGCLLTARLVGVIEASQTDDEGTYRNDRLIAIATHAHIHGEAQTLSDLDEKVVDEIEQFFVAYNKIEGRKFKPLGRYGPKRALKLVKEGMTMFRKNKKNRRTTLHLRRLGWQNGEVEECSQRVKTSFG